MKIDVVDNGGQWTHREWRVLRYLNTESKIIPNTTPFEDINVDGLVLSGGAPRIRDTKLGKTEEYLDNADFPILSICVAHQFLAIHFGGTASPAKIPEYGKVRLFVDRSNELFKNLPKKFWVWESHNDEIKKITDKFHLLAHSENCRYQAIKYKKKPFYGVQFHPEVEHTEHGSKIFKNFLEICKR